MRLEERIPAGVRRLLAATAVAAACGLTWAADDAAKPAPDAAAERAAAAFSEAERLLFVQPHLHSFAPPGDLRYSFRHAGSVDAPYEDTAVMHLAATAEGRCCAVRGDFLSGERRMPLPELDSASSNPVLLFFLERDVREMQRLTGGQQAHFRRRIRLALAQDARLEDVTLRYRGREVSGRQVQIEPYLTDSSRGRFEKFAAKRYTFVFSEAVPGGVYGIRSSIGDASAPLLAEELLIEGAETR